MSVYALVKGDLVENIILWDGKSPYVINDGVTAIEINDTEYVGPGFIYDSEKFTPPEPTAE